MKTTTSARSLRLPASIQAEAERLAAEDGTSLDRFVATAVAEKVSAMRTARFLAGRTGRADWSEFDRILNRQGGEDPRDGDAIPDAYRDDADVRDRS